MAKGIRYMRPMHPRNATSSETKPDETPEVLLLLTDLMPPSPPAAAVALARLIHTSARTYGMKCVTDNAMRHWYEA